MSSNAVKAVKAAKDFLIQSADVKVCMSERMQKMFLQAFQVFKDLNELASIDWMENGINMQMMDSAHIIVIQFLIKRTSLLEYLHTRDCTTDFSIVNFLQAGQAMAGQCTYWVHHKSDVSLMEIQRNEQNKVQFLLKNMNVEQEKLMIPETEYPVQFEMSSKRLQNVVKSIEKMGDTLTLVVTHNCITIQTPDGSSTFELKPYQPSVEELEVLRKKRGKGKGKSKAAPAPAKAKAKDDDDDDADELDVKALEQDMGDQYEVDEAYRTHIDYVSIKMDGSTDQLSTTVALDPVIKIMKASTVAPVVRLKLGHNIPLLFEFDVPVDNVPDAALLHFYLAPKIDEDVPREEEAEEEAAKPAPVKSEEQEPQGPIKRSTQESKETDA